MVDKLFKGLSGLLKGRKVTILSGPAPSGRSPGARCVDGDDAGTVVIGRNVVLAAGSVPRSLPGLRGRRPLGHDLRRVPRPQGAAGLGRRRRWRRHRLRVRLAACRTSGSKVTVLEALDRHPARLRRGHRPPGGPLLQEARHRGGDRGQGREPHAVESTARSRRSRPATRPSMSRPSWCRSAGAPAPRGWWPTASVSRSTSAASWWPTSTSAPAADGVWAVGDVVAGTPQLAHVGFAEAIVAVKGMLGEPVVPVDYGRVPWAIYCHPEVAFCGLTEEQAKAAGHPRRGQEGPVRRQQPGPDHRRHRGHGEDRGRADARRLGRPHPGRAHVRAVGDRAAGRRATWPSTGRPSPKRWRISFSRTRRCRRHSARR